MKTALGYAVIEHDIMLVTSVSDTRRAAIVNFLVVARGLMMTNSVSDEKIEALWKRVRLEAEVIPVKITDGLIRTKYTALVGCQNQSCAEEVSHHLDMVMIYKGWPICQECYEDGYSEEAGDEDRPDWHELPAIGLEDLKE